MSKAAKKGKQCSSAGEKLAECRWGKAKGKGKAMSKPAKAKSKPAKAKSKPAKPKARKPKAPPPKQRASRRQSRRLAGKGPVRQPEPPRKPRKKPKKGQAPASSQSQSYKAERTITGDPSYGMPLYGKGVSVLDGAYKQFRQAGYDRDL